MRILIVAILILPFLNFTFGQYPNNSTEKILSEITFDTIFYKSGAIFKIIPYRNGKMEGEQKWYYENGEILCYINYKEGKKNGPWIEYNDYGFVKISGYYTDDARDSLWIEHYYNKEIKSYGRYHPDINYINFNEIDSVQYLFTMSMNWEVLDSVLLTPNLIAELRLKYGDKETSYSLGFPVPIHFKDKIWQYWDNNGNLIKEEWWDKGNLISETKY